MIWMHCLCNEKSSDRTSGHCFLVGVSGFEPEASWTRTKRDTKLRHTPKRHYIIWERSVVVKGRRTKSLFTF